MLQLSEDTILPGFFLDPENGQGRPEYLKINQPHSILGHSSAGHVSNSPHHELTPPTPPRSPRVGKVHMESGHGKRVKKVLGVRVWGRFGWRGQLMEETEL